MTILQTYSRCSQFYVPALVLVLTFDSGAGSGFRFVFDVRVGVLDVVVDLERPSAQVYFKACRISSGFLLIFLPDFTFS